MLGTILVFRDDGECPYAELALHGGDRVRLALDGSGLTISQLGATNSAQVLFEAPAKTVAHLCAGLLGSQRMLSVTPLRVLVSAVVQLESAAQVKTAFENVAARLS